MFKVLYTSCALAVLWIGLVMCQSCEYQTELWKYEDPTKFYYCNPITNQSAIGDCPPNKGFVRNATVTGCVPWVEWNDTCVNKVNVAAITCEGDSFLTPHAVVNPGGFYLCIEQNATAVPLPCPEGRGFYAKDNFLGCFPWVMWRNLTGCE